MRRPLLGLLCAVLATASLAVPASPVAGEDAPVAIDHGAGPEVVHEVDGSFGADGVPGSGDDASAAVDVGGIRPGDGFATFNNPAPNFGAYRFQLVRPNVGSNPADVEGLRASLVAAAAHLSEQTTLPFSVDPGVVTCDGCASNEHWPASQPPLVVQGTQVRLNAQHVGIIRIRIASTSPCGTLAQNRPTNGQAVTVGCASPTISVDSSGRRFATRGSVWLGPALVTDWTEIQARVLLHEIGHALGLSHFSDRWPNIVTSPLQLLYPSIHGEASDLTNDRDDIHRGDRNGVWYLTHPVGWYLSATYQDFVDRPATIGEYRSNAIAFLDRTIDTAAYLRALSTSDAWVGALVDRFYRDVFGRNPDTAGRAYWTNQIRSRSVPAVAADFYGSPEYLQRSRPDVPGHVPGTVEGFVRALYRDLLGRTADGAGLAHWVGQVGARGRSSVALDFYQSFESRQVRVTNLYCTLLDRGPDRAGRDYWAGQVLTQGDLALAVNLASSPEYVGRSDDMALRPVTDPGAALPAPCAGF